MSEEHKLKYFAFMHGYRDSINVSGYAESIIVEELREAYRQGYNCGLQDHAAVHALGEQLFLDDQ